MLGKKEFLDEWEILRLKHYAVLESDPLGAEHLLKHWAPFSFALSSSWLCRTPPL